MKLTLALCLQETDSEAYTTYLELRTQTNMTSELSLRGTVTPIFNGNAAGTALDVNVPKLTTVNWDEYKDDDSDILVRLSIPRKTTKVEFEWAASLSFEAEDVQTLEYEEVKTD